jgi:hypothetical protein
VPNEDEKWKDGDVIDLYPEKPKPNKLVFKYMKPVERTVEGVKDEGKWVFYDVDLDAVRAELAKDIYLADSGLNRHEFKERQEFKRMLEEHIKRTNERRPEAGDYNRPEE